MAKKLYVGNLPYEVTNSQLAELFAKAGTVDSANVIIDNFSSRSKGFGFVEMSTDEEARKAIEMFKDYKLDGRAIVVNEARPRPKYQSRDAGGYGYESRSPWDRSGEKGYRGEDRRKERRGKRR